MHKRRANFARVFLRSNLRIIVSRMIRVDGRAERLNAAFLGLRRIARNVNHSARPNFTRSQRHCLSVIAGRCSNESARTMRLIQGRDGVASAAHLEGPRPLPTLQLHVRVEPSKIRQPQRTIEWSTTHHALDALACLIYLAQR